MFKKKVNWNKNLISALRDGDLEEATKCLDAGADVNYHYCSVLSKALSPVLVAVIERDDVDMLKFLIRKGLDINAIKGSENYAVPPIMLSMIYEKNETFKFLSEHKDINLKVSGQIFTADGRFPRDISDIFELEKKIVLSQKTLNILARAKIIALQRDNQTGEVIILPKARIKKETKVTPFKKRKRPSM